MPQFLLALKIICSVCVLCMCMYIQRVHTFGGTYMCIEAWGWSQVSRDCSLLIYCVRTSPWTHIWVFWLVCAASWIWGFPCLPLKHWDCQWALMCTQLLLDSGDQRTLVFRLTQQAIYPPCHLPKPPRLSVFIFACLFYPSWDPWRDCCTLQTWLCHKPVLPNFSHWLYEYDQSSPWDQQNLNHLM